MTDQFTNRLEERLNFPPTCPHGDPIPAADLSIAAYRERPLTTVPVGHRVLISRVTGEKEMLRFLGENGLYPGTSLDLNERSEGGVLLAETERGSVSLSPLASGAIFVRAP